MLKYERSRLQKKGKKKARVQNFSLTENEIIKYQFGNHPILEAKHSIYC